MYMNQITIIGFTGQDAELHYTQNGTPVTTLSVATKESWKNAQGEWQSRTEWHRVVAFGKLAEYAKTLPKGSHLRAGTAPLARIPEGRPAAPRHGTPRRQHRQTRPGGPPGGRRYAVRRGLAPQRESGGPAPDSRPPVTDVTTSTTVAQMQSQCDPLGQVIQHFFCPHHVTRSRQIRLGGCGRRVDLCSRVRSRVPESEKTKDSQFPHWNCGAPGSA